MRWPGAFALTPDLLPVEESPAQSEQLGGTCSALSGQVAEFTDRNTWSFEELPDGRRLIAIIQRFN